MKKDEFIINLETHPTRDIHDNHVNGSLTVVWRDWDKIIQNEPKMVYASYVEPGEIKGPHIHTKRNSYFVCLNGKAVFVIKNENGEYIEIESSEEKPILVFVPKNFASAHVNISNKKATILALADIAWRPNDNEMKNISFEDYNWNKWKKI